MNKNKIMSTENKTIKNNNIALYRKYRPSKFEDVLGQEPITKALSSSIASKHISHAYLFSGGRGIGKTTIARILAKELDVSEKDIYEIDAASHTGVDDIREIRESVHTLPFESQYKVYILDEAHMLSKSAFNALLKTLEEPPAHVIFMLATTEIEKIPDTIISRCETYTLKQPTRTVLRKIIQKVATDEGRCIGASAADLIAILADGSFRDALGILQKVLSASNTNNNNKDVEIEDVENITDAPKSKILNDLLISIASGNLDKVLETIAKAIEDNLDILILQQLLLHRARAVLLMRVSPNTSDIIKEQFNEEDFTVLNELAKDKDVKITSKTILVLLDAYADTKNAYIKHLPLELGLVRLLSENV